MDRVTSGQPIKITAEDYNRIIRAVEWTESHNGKTGTTGSLELEDGEFWVKNTCSYPLLAYQLCCVATNANGDGIEKAINITDGRTQAIPMDDKIPCVTQENIDAGEIGRAKFWGVSKFENLNYNTVHTDTSYLAHHVTWDGNFSDLGGVGKYIRGYLQILPYHTNRALMATVKTAFQNGRCEIRIDGETTNRIATMPNICSWEDADIVARRVAVYEMQTEKIGEN